MLGAYRHYGWECSPYSSKTRSYLRFKGIEHEDIYPTLLDFKRVIEKRLGYIVMPIVVTPEDETLQDSSAIIDHLEERFPEPSIRPAGPTQQLVSLLIELNADEWLPIIAMHTRWNDPQNSRFADKEFGANALPWMPGFTHSYLGHHMAGVKMRKYRKVFGITPKTQPAIDLWLEELLETLSKHFESYPFLLGSRPCLGDFALFGPLYAHVMRDPGSSHWVNRRPHVRQWIDRLREPSGEPGEFIADDEIPSTLDPILRRMFREQFPVLLQTVDRVEQWLREHPHTEKMPRGLGQGEFSLGGVTDSRQLMTFQQWMLQRPLDFYHSLSEQNRVETDQFLRKVGGLEAMQTRIDKRLTRRNFRIIAELTT